MNRRWGLIAGVVALAVAIATPWLIHWQRERAAASRLLEAPIYRTLQRREPAIYARLLAQYLDAGSDPTKIAAFNAHAMNEISATATQHLAHASQSSILALMRDMQGHLKELQRRGDDSCFRYLFPQIAGPPDVSRLFDARSQAHTLDLTADVIESSAAHPEPIPAKAAIDEKLAPIVDAVYAEYGPAVQMLSRPEDPHVDRAKVCAISISLYDRILALSPDDASAILRTMTQL